MLYFKDLLHKFYLKFSNSKLFKFFFGCVFLFFFIPYVHASEIFPGPGFYFQIGNNIIIDDTHNSLPYNGIIYAGNSSNLGAIQLSMAPQQNQSILSQPTYNYLYLQVCQSNSYLRMNISNSSTIYSYLVGGTYSGYDTGISCSTQSYNGSQYLFMIPVGKWELGEYSEWFEVASYNSFSSANGIYFTINRVFLSDEDLVATYRTQQELQNKLNTINTSITNSTTNIQNSITNSTNSVNNNIDQEFNDLKNQDHSYNNYPSDNVPNQSDINSVLTDQNTLSSELDLDTSAIDIQLNTDATTWIWGIVNNIRTLNGKITLLFTTILSLAIIKMVLNR